MKQFGDVGGTGRSTRGTVVLGAVRLRLRLVTSFDPSKGSMANAFGSCTHRSLYMTFGANDGLFPPLR